MESGIRVIKSKIDETIILKGDLAGHNPKYIYLSEGKDFLLSSDFIIELLESDKVKKPLKVNSNSLSFLLQSAVVPPPYSIYENLFILGVGDTLEVESKNGKLNLTFSHQFPFMDKYRNDNLTEPKYDEILSLITTATLSRLDDTKESFLFHSAGKDSNTIALALAESGLQDKFTLVTHRSEKGGDESEISKKIAKKLGFKHQILKEQETIDFKYQNKIEDFFRNSPFPCVDNVTLAYPLYSLQMPQLSKSNLIFGDGNDSHMLSPLDRRQRLFLPFSRGLSNFSGFRDSLNSESTLVPFFRTPAELFGMTGLTYKDSLKVYPSSCNVYQYWKSESDKRSSYSSTELKSDIYATRSISERMIRKLYNFADYVESNAILPFADSEVAKYFGKVPKRYLLNEKTLENKLILRKLLMDKMDLDSNKIGKMGWSFDSRGIVSKNKQFIYDEVCNSKYWDSVELNLLLNRLYKNVGLNSRKGIVSASLIYRVYLISLWLNHNKYIRAQ